MRTFIDYLRDHVFIVALIILIGGFMVLAITQRSDTPNRRDLKVEGVKTFSISERRHVNESVDYGQTPPVGGKHAGIWVGCNGQAYDYQIPNEQAVHALEHGAVWVTYQPSLEQPAVDKLKAKVQASNYTFLSPFPEQNGKIMLSAWNRQLTVDSVNDPRIDTFIQKFFKGAQTPEPGATCQAPQGSM